MNAQTITVTTRRGEMPVHRQFPPGPGPHPLVVIYMDAPGVRDALHAVASRLTDAGYATALPDLYYALDPADRPDPQAFAADPGAEFPRVAAAVSRLEDAEVIADTERMLAELGTTGDWGCIGFCAGGRFGLRAVARFGGDVAAAALIHPSRLVTEEPDSPHRALGDARAELYLAFGERDHVTPLDTIPPLEAALDAHGVGHRTEIIPGADHGFSLAGMPAYDAAASERALHGAMAVLGERI